MKPLLFALLFGLLVSNSPMSQAFSDIDTDTPNMEAIMTLSTLGITQGYDDDTFRPYSNINRAEFVKMVLQSQEISPTQKFQNCFSDVGTQWFAPYICYAKDQGWIQGMTAEHFAPERSITRAEAIKIILNTYNYQIPVTMGAISTFIDVEPSSWYAGYTHIAMKKNISDVDGTFFFPNNMITRGAASEMLYRTLMINYTKSIVFDRNTALDFLASQLGIMPNTEEEVTEYPIDMGLYFQIWNDLRYYHPDTDSISDEDMYYESIKGLAHAFKDPYTYFLSPGETKAFLNGLDGKYVGIGISFDEDELGIKVLRVFENSPAFRSSMQTGDIITAIEGKSMEGIKSEQVQSFMQGTEGTSVELTILRDGSTSTVIVQRAEVIIPTVEYKSVSTEIATIVINQFGEDTGDAMLVALQKAESEQKKKLIIDLRNNGGGYLDAAVEISSYFLPTNTLLFYSEDYPHPKKVKFTALPGIKLNPSIEVVVLVNEHTASAAEVLAASLQDNGRATVIGNYTFGKGVAQQLFPYIDNSILRVTTSKWYTPKDVHLSDERDGHKGLIPDIVITTSNPDEDTIFDAAINLLK